MPRLAVTHAAATKIRGLWAAAFSDNLVKSLTAIKNQVKKSLDKYGKFKGKQINKGITQAHNQIDSKICDFMHHEQIDN